MDFLMLSILAVSYLMIKLFADWCDHQIKKS
jgi:hypothetical protein